MILCNSPRSRINNIAWRNLVFNKLSIFFTKVVDVYKRQAEGTVLTLPKLNSPIKTVIVEINGRCEVSHIAENSDINITLDKNIDLTGKAWTPIGTDYDNSDKGTFDGGGHTITGLKMCIRDRPSPLCLTAFISPNVGYGRISVYGYCFPSFPASFCCCYQKVVYRQR